MSKKAGLWLGLIVLAAVTTGFFLLTRGHPWWDDFAGYLLQARSILGGSMPEFIRQSTFTINNSSYPPGPIAYPWGFPLLLAPVYAVFGLNPLALKLVGLAFYGASVVCAYLLACRRLDETAALLVTGALAFLPAMLAANDLILSDIPFLAFSTLSLYLIDVLPGKKTGWALLTGAAIFAAFFMRTNGILLLAPLLIGLVWANWPDLWSGIKKALPALLTFGALAVLQALIFPGGQGSYFSHFNMFSPQRLLDNFWFYLWLPASAFDQIPGGAALYPLLMVFVLVSAAARWRRDAALHAYSLLTLALFIVWPERQGLRFIYPVLPVFFIAAFDGMSLAAGKLKEKWASTGRMTVLAVWGLLLLVGLGISALSAYQNTADGREINGPFDIYSYQMYDYIRAKTPATSVVIFVRPRALRLFTERASFMTDQCGDLPKGDYVVIHLKMADNGQIAPEKVETCNPSVHLEQEYQNKRFAVYKIIR